MVGVVSMIWSIVGRTCQRLMGITPKKWARRRKAGQGKGKTSAGCKPGHAILASSDTSSSSLDAVNSSSSLDAVKTDAVHNQIPMT